MYLHTRAYYQRELQVPDKSGLSANGEPDLLEVLSDGIPRVFLENALGYENFTALDSFVMDGVLDAGSPQIWQDLVHGKEYTLDGTVYKWKGLAYEDGAFKVSILAQATYYYWLEDNLSKSTGVGEVVGNAKNTVNVHSTQKMVSIWNQFVQMNQHNIVDSYPNVSIIKGVKFTDWFKTSSNNYVSLVKFLQDHKEDYPGAPCKTYEIKNQFGI